MNEQKAPKGIEWTRVVNVDGSVRRGYTWNPIGGCRHDCAWQMPDQSVAQCYAKSVAEGVASAAYPDGFEAHYWHPDRLEEPLKVSEGAGIFCDSMSDLFGQWVPMQQIRLVFDVMRQTPGHIYQSLTKNPARLLKFKNELPPNLWVGVSMPPTFMWGKRLTGQRQNKQFRLALDVLTELQMEEKSALTWLSLEPMTFDVAPFLSEQLLTHGGYRPDWIVIGAASNGRKKYQPTPLFVQRVHDWAKRYHVPIFHKGNLDWYPVKRQFPTQIWMDRLSMWTAFAEPSVQLELFEVTG